MSPQYAHHVTLESLSAEWERVQDSLPDNLALRMRRALSWLKRAEKETDDDDAAFIFYWIAFNAAYAKDRPRDLEMTERSPLRRLTFDDLFFLSTPIAQSMSAIMGQILPVDQGAAGQQVRLPAILEPRFKPDSATDNWEYKGSRSRRQGSLQELSVMNSTPRFILNTLFDRLYVLRIQLMHGGATWQGSVNRAQVERWRQDNGLPRTPLRRPDDIPPG